MSGLDLFGLILTEIVGDFGFEAFANTGVVRGFIQGLAGYIGVVFFLIRTLKVGNVMWVNGMWDGLSGLVESLAAYVFLGERFSSPLQYVGLAFISVGLIFLKMTGSKGISIKNGAGP